MREISPYYPKSWFTDIGRAKILKELMPKLPDVTGKLFLTLTIDPKKFDDENHAFEVSRDKIRRMMYDLRQGIKWEGKIIKIDSPYFVKVEFHQSGYAHFHLIFMTRRYIPGSLLNKIWGLGRTNVKRIRNKTFHYLLKYVTKNCDLPDWVRNRTRIRIVQPSNGFYKDSEKPKRENSEKTEDPKERKQVTIGERLAKWEATALVTEYLEDGKIMRYTVELRKPYWEIIHEHAWEIAKRGDYLGSGKALFYPGSTFSKFTL